jgi:hypothetical protein
MVKKEDEEALPLFEMYRTMTWTLVRTIQFRHAPEIEKAGSLKVWLRRLRVTGPQTIATLSDSFGVFDTPFEIEGQGNPERPTSESPVLPPLPGHPDSRPSVAKVWGRRDVSGSGLLCGTRAVRGLVWTHRSINLREQDITARLQERAREFGVVQENLFTADLLVAYLWDEWKIPTVLEVNGVRQNMLPNIPAGPYPPAVLYLETAGLGHYNYHGVLTPRPPP